MPLMKSLRDFRLINLSGDCVPVEADVPVYVPMSLYTDALTRGMVEVKEDTAEDPAPTPSEEIEEPEMDAAEAATLLDEALIRIITRGDDEDFKKDKTPKARNVIAELPPECPSPTATQISDAFQRLQSNIDLAD